MNKHRNGRRGSWLEKVIANRYRRGGYNTKTHFISKKGEIDILASRGNKRLAIEVKSGSQTITSTVISKLYKKAKSLKAKPVLFIGPKVTLTSPARRFAKKLRVKIKRWTQC